MHGARPLRALACSLALIVSATPGHAGLTDAINKKLTDKATKKAVETVDKSSAKPDSAATSGKTAEAKQGGDAPAASTAGAGGKVSAVSTKFDFVPGDSVMFVDDFTQDELGEFPVHWKLVQGTFEVVEMEGERWLRCVSVDGRVRMKVPPKLPEFWTLEFDVTGIETGASTALTVSALNNSGSSIWEAVFPHSGEGLAFRNGEFFSVTPLEGGGVPGRHHVMFMARGSGLKAYMDRQRVASVPDISAAGVPTELDIRLWAPTKPMITNVRFAEGCKPAKDMLDSGKLVTYGIRFETGSDVVLPESAPVLRQVAAYMEAHTGVKLRITGHTDNVGSPPSNLDLSKRRAASVAKVLSEQFGVAADRFATDGKGDTQAVASNAKPEGRAMNRRVEFAKL